LKFQPEIIFTHHGGDLNVDHQKCFEAIMTATRPIEGEIVKTIISFETASATEWQATNEAKIKAMESYEFEIRDYPHPRFTEALRIQAKRWGVVVGKKHVEAFCIARKII